MSMFLLPYSLAPENSGILLPHNLPAQSDLFPYPLAVNRSMSWKARWEIFLVDRRGWRKRRFLDFSGDRIRRLGCIQLKLPDQNNQLSGTGRNCLDYNQVDDQQPLPSVFLHGRKE
ncbi:hypothetical protein NQ318_007877 [Aromia moschata]|uniref:Uncharacterized protein n=1 Tax=Aromia moschata TaxID=1265417 RepID=A0AAV8XFY2_9CUCU|nr:hypothetical protein NQ318_007877 [Aromia moschata]